eukprot:CAMPEP_0185513452 /NCGR_PEP_ID=MMETSP1366-20130426/56697_1 /TAXON_ID=38817 /ORGANISM="Gephyrocapsa oceanica, Strain RCC1303" /LENGTH=34 /DNA_ID= /DNA_START= /DNA_END= /DNA_ORIENTATION=
MAPLVVPSLSAARARRRRDMAVDGDSTRGAIRRT